MFIWYHPALWSVSIETTYQSGLIVLAAGFCVTIPTAAPIQCMLRSGPYLAHRVTCRTALDALPQHAAHAVARQQQ